MSLQDTIATYVNRLYETREGFHIYGTLHALESAAGVLRADIHDREATMWGAVAMHEDHGLARILTNHDDEQLSTIVNPRLAILHIKPYDKLMTPVSDDRFALKIDWQTQDPYTLEVPGDFTTHLARIAAAFRELSDGHTPELLLPPFLR